MQTVFNKECVWQPKGLPDLDDYYDDKKHCHNN